MKSNSSYLYTDYELPLVLQNKQRPPDRRQISIRWLAGTFLTGLTSCTLMGVALFAAFHGHEQLATPPELLSRNDMSPRGGDYEEGKEERLISTQPRRSFEDKRRFELSTMQRLGGRDVVRSQVFELVDMNLAEDHAQKFSYPKFNALKLFADPTALPVAENSAQIYGNKVESEVTLQSIPFPTGDVRYGSADMITANEAEIIAQSILSGGNDDAATLAALRSMSSGHGQDALPFGMAVSPDVKITQENVSVLSSDTVTADKTENYLEDIIPVTRRETLTTALERTDYSKTELQNLAAVLDGDKKNGVLPADSVIRLGVIATQNGKNKIVRASLYEDKEHIVSAALDDNGFYVLCNEPEITPVLRMALEGRTPVARVARNKLPTVYDAVFQSALSYNMSADIAKQLIRMLASDIDMQSHISSNDSLSVFYPLADEGKAGSKNDLDILYVKAEFGGLKRRYYRFQSDEGRVDYYDQDGKSSKQFLLRKPVPDAKFTSPFGTRRHPVLGYVRSHMGVDWAAPRGTPIIASGDGEILKAGWSSGYGNHTEIRHANGYVTSYSHQSGFASGVHPGVRVRQGQIIGYVGSTGLSTGPHCHFEMIVNGTKVDPMRIRLPDAKALTGEQLQAFKRERAKIDALMNNNGGNTRVAAATFNNG